MAISRGQMERQLREGGGIMSLSKEGIGGGDYRGIDMGSRTGFGILKKISALPYIYYSGPKCTDPDYCNESEIRERLVDIIEQEGPMFVEVAFKSYLRSAGIQKLGRQIRNFFLPMTKITIQ